MYKQAIQCLSGRQANILGHEDCFESAVILPLVEKDGQYWILFQKRADNIHQPGEISFPGGRIETEDSNPQEAAVRETCEEIGLNPEDIKVIAPLDIMVSPLNTIVYPFLGEIINPDLIKANPAEVAELFYVPLEFFLNCDPLYKPIALSMSAPEDFPFDMIPQGKAYPFMKGIWPQFFYVWEDRVIWGLTARILTHFLRLIKSVC